MCNQEIRNKCFMGKDCPGSSGLCSIKMKIEREQGICPLVQYDTGEHEIGSKKYYPKTKIDRRCHLMAIREMLPPDFKCFNLERQECLLQTKIIGPGLFRKIFRTIEDVSSPESMMQALSSFKKQNLTVINQHILKAWEVHLQ